MKDKLSNIIFIAVFLLILSVPAFFINTATLQISEIDNEILPEWPGFDLTLSTVEEVEEYVNDRIGFREQLVSLYILLNDKLFHVMTHPLFMYGEEGHIYYKDPSYIKAYQRLNTNEKWLDGFTDFLAATDEYLKDKGIPFIYYLCPDKKTIYPEYFPRSVNVNTENKTVPGYIREKLEEYNSGKPEEEKLDYIIPIEELTEAKKEEVVYNKLYDATHWNEDGAFLGHELIDKRITSLFDDVRPLLKEDYNRTMKLQETLDVARFPIHEEVPSYTLINDTSNNMTDYLLPVMKCSTPNFYSHYTNPEAGNGRILLIFTDSYFATYPKFYLNRFGEVYFVHRQNYAYLQYFVNLVFPDMVIFETAERSISGEMMEQVDFNQANSANVLKDDNGVRLPVNDPGRDKSKPYLNWYEPPYKVVSKKEAAPDKGNDDSPDVMLTEIRGVRKENNRLLLNVNEGESIISLTGYVVSDRDYYVYAKIGEESVVEAQYEALNNSDPGLHPFSVNIQRRYLSELDIDLIAVEEETGEEFILETYEVRYVDE